MLIKDPYVELMRHLPTQTDLSDLGVRLAHEGFGPHESAVAEVVTHARHLCAPAGIIALVGNNKTATNLRSRAFDRLTRDWASLRQAAISRERASLDTEIDSLLETWNKHQDLRAGKASIAELFESRLALDEQRAAVASQRCA